MPLKTDALDEKLAHIDVVAPIIVEDSAPYGEVIEKMRRLDRGSAVVCRRGVVVGIFTERDLLNKCALEDVAPGAPVGGLMTPQPVTVTAYTTLGKAVELMHGGGVRNLPIIDAKGRPSGILTVGRIIRYLADHFPAEVVNLPPVLDRVAEGTEGA